MKAFFLFSLTLIISLNIVLASTTITGNTSVIPGSIETYNVSWETWDNTFQNFANVDWNVTGGIIITSDKNSVTIQWNTLEGYLDGVGIIEITEDLGGQNSQLGIFILNNVQSTSNFCSGILGAPKVFIDFGSGSNPGPPLSSGTTSYQYSTNCSLEQGQYTITNNSNFCRTFWHNIPSDHTGNPNGYFLMLNASSDRNEIYRATVSGLTTSISYEFSSWVGNLYNTTGGQDPNIRFEIYSLTGALIASSGSIIVSPSLPTFQSQKISFMFQLPPSVTSVQVVIVNARTATTNVGNDLVLDDISFAPCLPGIVASFSSSSLTDKSHTCNNGTINLFGSWQSSIPFSSPVYQWQKSVDEGNTWFSLNGGNQQNFSHSENLPGIFQYRLLTFESTNPSFSIASNKLIYYVQTIIVDSMTTRFSSCQNSNVSGNLPSSFKLLYSDPADSQSLNFSFVWTPSSFLNNPNTSSPYANFPGIPPPTQGQPAQQVNYLFNLTVTNNNYGCTATNIQRVSIYSPRKIGVPNAFTPDVTGPNNVFVPINIEDYPGAIFSIYNRWGTRVFYSQGPTKADYSWDGRYNGVPQPQEVYHWTLELPFCKTNIISSTIEGKTTGDVTLLR